MDAHEALGLAIENRAVHLAQLLRECFDLDALGLRVLFVKADVGDFRRRVGRPRDDEGTHLGAAFEQRVLYDDARHEIRRVRELIRRADVAAGIDARVGGLQSVVDLHAFLVELDADGFESESLDIGSAPDSHEKLIDQHVVALAMRANLQAHAVRVFGEFKVFAAAEEFDAVAFQRGASNLRGIAVLARQNPMLRFDQENLRAEAREALRHLAPNRAGANDPETLRQFGQREK